MNESAPRIGKFRASWQLTRACWRTLLLDKELAVLPLMGIVISLIAVVFVIAFSLYLQTIGMSIYASQVTTNGAGQTVEASAQVNRVAMIIGTALVSFTIYAISNFFAVALSWGALQRFKGEDPSLRSCMAAARRHIGTIIGFSGLQATIGLILNTLQEKLPFAGKIAVWLVGAAWNVATIFAIPVIADDREKSPLRVVRTSASVFKGVWQESVLTGAGVALIGAIMFALWMVLWGVIGGLVLIGLMHNPLLFVGVFILATIPALVLMAALNSILMTSVYYYATRHQLPAGYDEQLIRAMFRPKKKWLGA